MRSFLSRLLWLPLALMLAATAQAATLDDIVKRGVVKIGIDLGVPPYGLTDANQKPAGYDVEVAELMAKDLGIKLEIVPLTGPNRIPFLLTNKVDVV
ncbi:MAG: transporter substrate-binding domain-containing protein, partial [Alphaproteobacteria bacterium]